MEKPEHVIIKYLMSNAGRTTYGNLTDYMTAEGYSNNDFLLAMHFLKSNRNIEGDCEICSVTPRNSDIYLTDQ